MGSKAKLIFIGVLAMISLVTGLKAWGIVRDEMIPDLRGDQAEDVLWEPHTQTWRFELENDTEVSIDLADVDVVLQVHQDTALLAVFDGQRKEMRPGSRTELAGSQSTSAVTFAEDKGKSRDPLGLSAAGTPSRQGAYRGTLTLTLPDNRIKHLNVRLFSGAITVDGCTAGSVVLESNQGSIRASGLKAADRVSITTFSGTLQLSDFYAGECTLRSSSGSSVVKRGRSESLYVDQYAGALSLEDVEVIGALTLLSSEGRLFVQQVQAASLSARVDKGMLDLTDTQIGKDAGIEASDGEILLENIHADRLEAASGAGSLICRALTAQEVSLRSESGDTDLSLSAPGNVRIVNEQGRVTLRLPEEMGFRLSVRAPGSSQELGFKPVQFYKGAAGQDSFDCQIGQGDWKVGIDAPEKGFSLHPLSAQK